MIIGGCGSLLYNMSVALTVHTRVVTVATLYQWGYWPRQVIVILVTIVVLMAPKAVGVTVEVSVAPNLAAMVSTMLAKAMTDMINLLTTLVVVVEQYHE
jgi:hypothetical protein